MNLFEFTWNYPDGRQYKQVKRLINHPCSARRGEQFFTIYSPLFDAMIAGTGCIDLGFGTHNFTVTELTPAVATKQE